MVSSYCSERPLLRTRFLPSTLTPPGTVVSQRCRALCTGVTRTFAMDLAIHAASRRLSSTFDMAQLDTSAAFGAHCARPPRPERIRFTMSLAFDVAGLRGRECTVLHSCAASRWSVRRKGVIVLFYCNCCSRLSLSALFRSRQITGPARWSSLPGRRCIICHALTDSASRA